MLVAGSGAGGMTAALVAAAAGQRVILVEKAEHWGGASATSGGFLWIPASHLAAAQGADDSPEEAYTYLRHVTDAVVTDASIRAFIRGGREMLEWLEQHSEVRYRSIPYTDYRPTMPGARQGFRTHDVLPMDGQQLGDAARHAAPVRTRCAALQQDRIHHGRCLPAAAQATWLAASHAQGTGALLPRHRSATQIATQPFSRRRQRTARPPARLARPPRRAGLAALTIAGARLASPRAAASTGAIVEREGECVRIATRLGVILQPAVSKRIRHCAAGICRAPGTRAAVARSTAIPATARWLRTGSARHSATWTRPGGVRC